MLPDSAPASAGATRSSPPAPRPETALGDMAGDFPRILRRGLAILVIAAPSTGLAPMREAFARCSGVIASPIGGAATITSSLTTSLVARRFFGVLHSAQAPSATALGSTSPCPSVLDNSAPGLLRVTFRRADAGLPTTLGVRATSPRLSLNNISASNVFCLHLRRDDPGLPMTPGTPATSPRPSERDHSASDVFLPSRRRAELGLPATPASRLLRCQTASPPLRA